MSIVDDLRRVWHRLFGHPRPYIYTGDATYCGTCGDYITHF